MSELPRISSAEVIIHGVLKIIFKDGYEGVVDLRPLMPNAGCLNGFVIRNTLSI
jgi:hypothetical protein